jgi:hypothetical protein
MNVPQTYKKILSRGKHASLFCLSVNEREGRKVLQYLTTIRPREAWLQQKVLAGSTIWEGRLSTVDLLVKVACFAKKVNNIFITNVAD